MAQMICAATVALATGIGVYRSATYHRHILVGALALDAMLAAAMIGAYHLTGIW